MIFYIIPTPIGNLDDLSNRALKILSKLDFLVVENFSITRKLLNHYSINIQNVITYNDHSNDHVRNKILDNVKKGLVGGLVSDSGTPLISDPGFKLIQTLAANNINIVSIPGPSSVTSALAGSGLPTDSFQFLGFFPRKDKDRKLIVKTIERFAGTSIFFDSPKRLLKNLVWLQNNSDFNESDISIAKEISKLNEKFIRGKGSQVVEKITKINDFFKGEFVVLIKPIKKEEQELKLEQFYLYFSEFMPKKDLINAVHLITGEPKNKIYKLFLALASKD